MPNPDTTPTDTEIAAIRARWGCDQMDKELDQHMEGATVTQQTTPKDRETDELEAVIDEWIAEAQVGVNVGDWAKTDSSGRLAEYLIYCGYERKQP